jgi:hypothetical protein
MSGSGPTGVHVQVTPSTDDTAELARRIRVRLRRGLAGSVGNDGAASDAVGSSTSAPTLSIAAPRISCARSRSSMILR